MKMMLSSQSWLSMQLDSVEINDGTEGGAILSNKGHNVVKVGVKYKGTDGKPPAGVSVCTHFFQILEAIMDIMQVLQMICKNPEAHDRGT